MSRKAHDRMKDPYYGMLMAGIERVIARADAEAREQGRKFTDSQVRSTLIKAIKIAKGGKPAVPANSEHEKLLARLIPALLDKREDMRTALIDEESLETGDREPPSEPASLGDWIRAMEAVEASIRIRTEMEPGSRGYLEFVEGFVKKMPMAQIIKR